MSDLFQDCFCRHFNVTPDRYIDEVLRRTLTPQTRFLRIALLAYDRNYFAADREFIAGVGQLTYQGDFRGETLDFRYHPSNRGILRRNLRLRVSAYRMRCLLDEVWPGFVSRRAIPTPSLSPFTARGNPPTPESGA